MSDQSQKGLAEERANPKGEVCSSAVDCDGVGKSKKWLPINWDLGGGGNNARQWLGAYLQLMPSQADYSAIAKEIRKIAFWGNLPVTLQKLAKIAENFPSRQNFLELAAQSFCFLNSIPQNLKGELLIFLEGLEEGQEIPSLSGWRQSEKGEKAPIYDSKWWEGKELQAKSCASSSVIVSSSLQGIEIKNPLKCRCRNCPACARSALRQQVSKNSALLLACPLKRGFKRQFIRIGSPFPINTPEDYKKWRANLGYALDKLADKGYSSCAIDKRSFVAGVSVIESVLREDGSLYAHAHIVAVTPAFLPYGLSLERLLEIGAITEDKKARIEESLRIGEKPPKITASQVAKALEISEEEAAKKLGIRELFRRAGVGENWHTEEIKGENGLIQYLSKIEEYISKIDQDGSIFRNPQAQWILKGTRRLSAFGLAYGLCGGKAKIDYFVDGLRDQRKFLRIEANNPSLSSDPDLDYFSEGENNPTPDLAIEPDRAIFQRRVPIVRKKFFDWRIFGNPAELWAKIGESNEKK